MGKRPPEVDAISLRSIDIADSENDFDRFDSNVTSDEDDDTPEYGGGDMSVSLTSHAQRMSGRVYTNSIGSDPHQELTFYSTPRRISKNSHTLRKPSLSRNRDMSPARLGRRVSLAVHSASARVVNLSNHALDRPESPELEHAEGETQQRMASQQDYFSTTRPDPGPTHPNVELQGHSLGVFGPDNFVRRRLLEILSSPFIEPFILLLIIFQVVVLTLDSSISNLSQQRILTWGKWTDWALLAIFVLYSLECIIRSIVSGFIINPEARTGDLLQRLRSRTHDRQRGRYQTDETSAAIAAALPLRNHSSSVTNSAKEKVKASILKTAYLRHSLTRIDLISIVSFWVYFFVSIAGIEATHHIFIFKALSCLRILRLLNVTKGTSTILRSLKKSAPLLVNVAFFVGFFWIFIAVIGVQTFKGSFRRQCVWVDPAGLQPNQTQYLQFCGGQWQGGEKKGFLLENWQSAGTNPKGYICPEQSWCVQNLNPYNGTVHFDNIFNSMELVFVIMSTNTFTDLMYYTMDSDYFSAAFFFIIGTLILTFWLMSLVIAVVTTSFQVIRAEQHSSAFGSTGATRHRLKNRRVRPCSRPMQLWDNTRWFWVTLVGADLVTQACKTSSMSSSTWHNFGIAEDIFTILFAVEIIGRFACCFPDWRSFASKSNFFDLFLAVITCIILIPMIRDSGSLYRWLTIFQILRSYRIIYAIPLTRNLLTRILGNTTGLLNLIFFLLLAVYISAIIACQLIRGDAPTEVYGEAQEMTFKNIFNAFVAMYQILSSENWTAVLYAVQSNEALYHQAWIAAIFFIVWFVFSQNILMSMFIAVLQENLEVSEDDKRREQVRILREKSIASPPNNQTNLTVFSLLKTRWRQKQQPQHDLTPHSIVAHEDNIRAFLGNQPISVGKRTATMQDQLQGPIKSVWRLLKSKARPKRTSEPQEPPFPESGENFAMSPLATTDPNTITTEVTEARNERATEYPHYSGDHPTHDKALWLLGSGSYLRCLCQRIVAPSYGERLAPNVKPVLACWYIFTAFMYICTVAIVVLACIVTPVYQKSYQINHGEFRFAWFTWSDLAFTIIFSLEALIKVVADGFWLTPNGYLRNTWNRIDFFVLGTLWINLIGDVLDRGSLSRDFRAFKALRALRLVNISDATKATFHDVFIAGFWNIAGAAIVSLALLIPMAIWGLNMFAGLLFTCNDSGVSGVAECYYEYASTPMTWDVWAPRSWENPQVWSFDSFGKSLLILFEIVSQEGWIDVMTSAMAITGKGDQPEQDAAAVNAVFFIIFNLLGAVFVLTLFIAVIIQNYSERSGAAYLTTEQRSWQEMRLLLKQVRPSRRPVDAPGDLIRRRCYFAVKKHSLWNKILIAVYCAHVILLMTEHFPEQKHYATVRNSFFLACNITYLLGIVVRVIGLGLQLWLKSWWNVYNVAVVPISTALTFIAFRAKGEVLYAVLTAQKIFLVLVAMNLIPAIDSLDQLFKTTVGSLSALASLMATWLVLFVTFAIALNQIFSLTKLGNNGSDQINLRTIPKALVLLFRMSCGEGWNSIMHDYAIAEPYCTASRNFYDSDCGSERWAYSLFIAWNIISMYIFVNIVISLVYNNFSYVYQRSGKMSSVSRREIRHFKATWAEFDDGTGHIPKSKVARFLSKLEGAFEVRIYPSEYSLRSFRANCRNDLEGSRLSGQVLNLEALNKMTQMMDVHEIRRRRVSFKRLHTELMLQNENQGISFTSMLLILSHNKFVDEEKSLEIDEYLRRKGVRAKVDRALSDEYRANFFDLIECRSLLATHRRQGLNNFRTQEIPDRLAIPSSGSMAGKDNFPSSVTPIDRHAWRIGHRSPDRSVNRDASGHNSPSPEAEATVIELLAGSAWSSALEEN